MNKIQIARFLAIASFLIGVISNLTVLWIVGGALILLLDILGILTRQQNPLILIALWIVLAIFITPWYLVLMWASVGFFLGHEIIHRLSGIMNLNKNTQTTLKNIDQRDLRWVGV